MELVPVFEQSEIPKHIIEKLLEIYNEDDHRAILNDSYTMYQHIYDIEVPFNEVSEWFKNKTDGSTDYIIIHWEW